MEDKQNTSVKNASEEAFDVTGFFLECISYWKWFVASVVVLAVAVMFYCFRQTPVYEVTSAVYIQDNKGDNSNILLESLGLSSYKKNIDNEIEVLRSKNQITDVVEALNLYTSYSWNSFLRNVPLYEETPIEAVLDSIDVRSLKASLNIRIKPQNGVFHLEAKTRNVRGDEVEICNTTVETFPYSIPFHKGFIRLRYTGDTIPTVDKTLNISLSNPRSVSKSIAGNLTVAFASKDATILKVVYRTPVIKAGEDFIKTLVDFYNIDAAKQKNQGTEKTQQFIDARLDSISKDLSVVEARVEEYRRHNNLIDISSEAKLYLEQTGFTDEKLAELELQKSLVDYVEKFLSIPQNEYMPIPALGIDDKDLAKLIGEYNKSLQQRERLLHSSSESNPVIVELTRDIQTQRSLVLKGVESIRKGVEIKKRDLSRQDKIIEDKIKNVPQYERELSDIMRQQRIKDNLYVFLLKKIAVDDCLFTTYKKDLLKMLSLTESMTQNAIFAFTCEDIQLAKETIETDDQVDELHHFIGQHLPTQCFDKILSQQEVTDALCINSMAYNIERIGDNATNIAEAAIYLIEGKNIKHWPKPDEDLLLAGSEG